MENNSHEQQGVNYNVQTTNITYNYNLMKGNVK